MGTLVAQISATNETQAASSATQIADATSVFGLQFLNNLANDGRNNVVFSPFSLQNLLNMILLGTGDKSPAQLELTKALGYNLNDSRLLPHQAMHEVFQSIMEATHLNVPPQQPQADAGLLNTNAASLKPEAPTLEAHLQTSVKEGDEPLIEQLNFTLANLVLTNKDRIELNSNYEKELKTYYDVNVEQFSNNTKGKEGAEKEAPLYERVNSWVKNMTQQQIDKLVTESDLEDVVMVLVNAAHFKGRWLHTFNTKATVDKYFYNHGSDQQVSNVQFMRQKDVFGFADFSTVSLQNELGLTSDSKTLSSEDAETLLTEDLASGKNKSATNSSTFAPIVELSKEETRRMELTARLNCTVLSMPFSLNDGQELSMVFFLPSRRDGIKELEAALDSATLREIYKAINEQQVQVEMPKFSFESTVKAKETLVKMGVSAIFKSNANLERMLNSTSGKQHENVQVDKILHKSKIMVDESGAEAAAASAATIVLRNFIRQPTPVFVADHPFLFIIRHNKSNMPLFMGRVSKL